MLMLIFQAQSWIGFDHKQDCSVVVFVRSVMLKSWDGFESKEFFRVASQHEMNLESSAVERNGERSGEVQRCQDSAEPWSR